MKPSGRSWLNSVGAQYRGQRLDQNVSLYAASSLIFGFVLPLMVVTFAKLVECLDIVQEDMNMKSLFCKKKKGFGAEHAPHDEAVAGFTIKLTILPSKAECGRSI